MYFYRKPIRFAAVSVLRRERLKQIVISVSVFCILYETYTQFYTKNANILRENILLSLSERQISFYYAFEIMPFGYKNNIATVEYDRCNQIAENASAELECIFLNFILFLFFTDLVTGNVVVWNRAVAAGERRKTDGQNKKRSRNFALDVEKRWSQKVSRKKNNNKRR